MNLDFERDWCVCFFWSKDQLKYKCYALFKMESLEKGDKNSKEASQ